MAAAKGLGELLIREQLITVDQLEAARREQKAHGTSRLGAALVKLGYVSDDKLTDFMSKQYQVPAIDLATFEIDPEALKIVPKDICEKHGVIPISKSGNNLVSRAPAGSAGIFNQPPASRAGGHLPLEPSRLSALRACSARLYC